MRRHRFTPCLVHSGCRPACEKIQSLDSSVIEPAPERRHSSLLRRDTKLKVGRHHRQHSNPKHTGPRERYILRSCGWHRTALTAQSLLLNPCWNHRRAPVVVSSKTTTTEAILDSGAELKHTVVLAFGVGADDQAADLNLYTCRVPTPSGSSPKSTEKHACTVAP